jgi:hypothetical protein
MHRSTVARFPSCDLLALLPLPLLMVSAAGCKEPCKSQVEPDGRADFSSLRLKDPLLCDPVKPCTVTFNGNLAKFAMEREAGKRQELVYEVVYQGTQEQVQDVLLQTSLGGTGMCGTTQKYRRENWTVPTVTMNFQSATENGQPLLLDSQGSGVGLIPSYGQLTVLYHYVDRNKADEYVGILVRGLSAPNGMTILDWPITKSGSRFNVGPDNKY